MRHQIATVMWLRCGLLLTVFNKESVTLRDVRIDVPVAVVRDKNATLRCLYDLEGDQLYSVKWYFRSSEFYRFTPKENPPIKQFQRGDLVVNESASDRTRVVLEKVPKSLSGQYTCEVTTDQPSFFTAMRSAELTVVDLPETDPYIIGLRTRYHLLETLHAVCICERSNPPVNLTWYLNGQSVEEVYIRKYIQMLPQTRVYTVHSTLKMVITKELHLKHRLKIRCVANLFNVYHKSIENSVELGRKRHRNTHYQRNSNLTMSAATTITANNGGSLDIHWDLAQAAEVHRETKLIFFPPVESSTAVSPVFRLEIILIVVPLLR